LCKSGDEDGERKGLVPNLTNFIRVMISLSLSLIQTNKLANKQTEIKANGF